jgi:hypothetical protein
VGLLYFYGFLRREEKFWRIELIKTKKLHSPVPGSMLVLASRQLPKYSETNKI